MWRKLLILRSEYTTQECINVVAQEIIAREGESIDFPSSRKGIEIQRYPRCVSIFRMLRKRHRVACYLSNPSTWYLSSHIPNIETILVLRLLLVSVMVDRCSDVRQSLQGNRVRGRRLVFALMLRPGPGELRTVALLAMAILLRSPRAILRLWPVKSRT